MKRHLLFGLCLALLSIASCSRYPSESQRINSAFEQAKQVYGDGENDTLLFIPELDKASAYYVCKKDFGKAAFSALYQGYAEKDYDKTLAMDAFKEAERYGELVGDSLTMARAEYQMGRMLYNDYLYDDALMLFDKSCAYFGCHYAEKVKALNGLACCYMLLGAYVRADSSLNLALHYAELSGSVDTRNKVLNNYGVLYSKLGDYDKAIACLRCVKPSNRQQALLNQFNIGNAFLDFGVLDSVAFYYDNLEKSMSETDVRIETQASIYFQFAKFAKEKGDLGAVVYYNKCHLDVLDRIYKDHVKKSIYRINQQYDFEVLQNALNKKIIIRQRIITGLVLVIGLIVIVLFVLQTHLAKITRQEADLKAKLLDNMQRHLVLEHKNEEIYEKLLKALTKEQHIMQKLEVYSQNPNDPALLQSLKYTVWGGDGFWNSVINSFDKQFPGMRKAILEDHPDITVKEQKILILSYLDTSREDTALLLHVSIHMVDKLRNSVKKKLNNTFFSE